MTRIPLLALVAIVALSGLSCGDENSSPISPVVINDGAKDRVDPGPGGSQDEELPKPSGLPPLNSIVGSGMDPDAFPMSRIQFGGVPKDGIPALTDPTWSGPSGAGYLSDSDLVLGVSINGEARAYPHNILWWHEIVNDHLGGKQISVTYCPLTGTGLVFDADAIGGDLTLGVSGLLYNNNLIMYDRRDGDTLYPQMYFTGVSGPNKGTELVLLPVVETTWGMWKSMYPSTTVVSGNTGYSRDYRRYPYGDYDRDHRFILFPLEGSEDNRLEAKNRVLGTLIGQTRKAYPFFNVTEPTAINDLVAGTPILVLVEPTSQTAIPYERQVDGRVLTFVPETDGASFRVRDEETGTVWNLKGQAISGLLEGKALAQIPAYNAYWFAWSTFWTDVEIWNF